MTTIKLRRGTAAQWTSTNPVLLQGEPGFETDTGKHKIGDGTSTWSQLKYFLNEIGLNNAFGGPWVASTAYAKGDVFAAPDGTLRQVVTAHTSGTTYSTANTSGLIDPVAIATRTNSGISGWATSSQVVARALDWIIVTDPKYGASTAAADNSAAFAAATATAKRTWVPPGRYKFTSGFATAPFSSLGGSTTEFGVGTATTMLDFTALSGSAVCITAGVNASMDNIVAMGPGGTVGTVRGIYSPVGSPRLHRVSMLDFAVGADLVNAYYSRFDECEWSRNGISLRLTGCYNVDITTPRMYCTSGSNYGIGIQITDSVKALNVSKGSIEAYQTGISIPDYGGAVNVHGTYFESSSGAVGCVAVDAGDGQHNISVSFENCMVYALAHVYVVKMLHAINCTLNARANKYIYSQYDTAGPNLIAPPTNPLFYGFLTPGTGTVVNLLGDNTSDCYAGGAQNWGLTDNIWNSTALQGAIQNFDVQFPYRLGDHRSSYRYLGRTPVYPVVTVTGTATLAETTHHQVVNSASATTQTLSTVAGQSTGRTHTISNIGTGVVTVATSDGSTITGQGMIKPGQSVRYLLYNGNWITEGGHALPVIGQASARWYGPGGTTTLLLVQNRLYAQPFLLRKRRTPANIAGYISTAGSTGATVRLGIYTDNDGSPGGALIADTGVLVAEATGSTPTAALANLMDPGMYWLVTVAQASPTTQPTMRANLTANELVGLNGMNNFGVPGYYYASTVAGALPSTLSPTNWTDSATVPSVWLKMD